MSAADHVQGESPPEGEPAGELSRSTNPVNKMARHQKFHAQELVRLGMKSAFEVVVVSRYTIDL